jgi:hypothetical protein
MILDELDNNMKDKNTTLSELLQNGTRLLSETRMAQ